MKCPRCDTGNREGARFCRECGALFETSCSSCGARVQAGSKFCDTCGIALATTVVPVANRDLSTVAVAAGIAAKPNEPADAERRQLTVLFCDLVGSTELAARLDPEVLRDVVHAYQQVCDAVIKRFRGHVAQYLGDGLLVYFGYPVAGEDDPRRAVHGAVGIINELAALNDRLRRERDITLAVRIGIHTGPVVVPDR
jgi:class 3 adenylate cyclase